MPGLMLYAETVHELALREAITATLTEIIVM